MRLNRSLVLCALATASLLPISAAQAGPVAGQGNWQTTLKPRDINGDGTVDAFYDTVLNVTWLADGNAGAGSVYDSANGSIATDGKMNWFNAVAWAASLDIFGVTGWRLPTMIDTGAPGCNTAFVGTDCGTNVQTISADGKTVYSELAHLYYETLGNLARCDTSGDCSLGNGAFPDFRLSNTGDFRNLQARSYWTGVAYAPAPAQAAWYFITANGHQGQSGSFFDTYAIAVRPGDVAAFVPEPQTPWLVLLALGAAIAATRRQVRKSSAA